MDMVAFHNTGLPAKLDTARQALAEASTDFELLRVRDHAAAVQAAAAILKRKDVQVDASLLVAEAEREIAKANPPAPPGRGKKVEAASTISKATRSELRKAHTPITDKQFADLKNQAREQGQPLTRQAIKDVAREAEKVAEREAKRKAAVAIAPTLEALVYHCAVADLHKHIEAGSVDAIVTAPPYPRKFVPVYGDLAHFAVHALRPGGLLMAIAGQPYLPDIFHWMGLAGPRLKYRWIAAYFQQGASQKIHSAKVTVKWKPFLVFTRAGGHPQGYSNDWIDSGPYNAADKDKHHWGQTEAGLEAVIREWVKEPGSLVCDPICGAGSTLLATRTLGHRVIGADIDEVNVNITREALA